MLGFECAHGRNFDDVFRIVIDQLEPIFGDVGGRENIVFGEFGDKGELQIGFADPLLLLGGDGALDRDASLANKL